MSNPEVPFGLESFDPELTTEGLMAERKRQGQALKFCPDSNRLNWIV